MRSPHLHRYGTLVLTLSDGARWYHDDILEVATLVPKGKQAAIHTEVARTREDALGIILAARGHRLHRKRSALVREAGR